MPGEARDREDLPNRILRWGISYIDDSLEGIFANDLVLLGAPPGVGKTAMCVGIATTNLMDEKRIHLIALEAHTFEIERRLKYRYFCEAFFSDHNRPHLDGPMNFKSWLLGRYKEQTRVYNDYAEEFCRKAFVNLFTLYKTSKFGVADMVEQVNSVATETDLVIIDHAHYFDFDDKSDNESLKRIVHTARDLTQEIGRPMILVAHLRKRDRGSKELCPGMDDFHGSSELAKVATKCVTIAPGTVTVDGKYVTYIRCSKDRNDSGPARYLGITTFNPKKGGYDEQYRIAWANSEQPCELPVEYRPDWARHYASGGGGNSAPQKPAAVVTRAPVQRAATRVYVPD